MNIVSYTSSSQVYPYHPPMNPKEGDVFYDINTSGLVTWENNSWHQICCD